VQAFFFKDKDYFCFCTELTSKIVLSRGLKPIQDLPKNYFPFELQVFQNTQNRKAA